MQGVEWSQEEDSVSPVVQHAASQALQPIMHKRVEWLAHHGTTAECSPNTQEAALELEAILKEVAGELEEASPAPS